jgi:hypothetical protein
MPSSERSSAAVVKVSKVGPEAMKVPATLAASLRAGRISISSLSMAKSVRITADSLKGGEGRPCLPRAGPSSQNR